MSSILHRASAIICYIALFIVAIGVLTASFTKSLPLEGLIFSPLGAIGLFIFLFAFTFMAVAQLRHAIWNRGAMFDPAKNNFLSVVMVGFAVGFSAVITLAVSGVI